MEAITNVSSIAKTLEFCSISFWRTSLRFHQLMEQPCSMAPYHCQTYFPLETEVLWQAENQESVYPFCGDSCRSPHINTCPSSLSWRMKLLKNKCLSSRHRKYHGHIIVQGFSGDGNWKNSEKSVSWVFCLFVCFVFKSSPAQSERDSQSESWQYHQSSGSLHLIKC